MTQPPKPFNDASLLSAMTGIARYVSDKEIRKVLKDTDGLGTEATRAGIIELLFKRGFLTRKAKNIHATETGTALINALPGPATRPDMTARWEQYLNSIVERQGSYQTFMQDLEQQLRQLLQSAGSAGLGNLSAIPAKPFRRKRNFRKKKTAS